MATLFTFDESDHLISTDAEIEQTADLAEWTEHYNAKTFGLKIGSWTEADGASDAWLKLHCHPSKHFEINDAGNAIIDGIECTIKAPGTHPGGDAYWLDPVDTVMIPVWNPEDE